MTFFPVRFPKCNLQSTLFSHFPSTSPHQRRALRLKKAMDIKQCVWRTNLSSPMTRMRDTSRKCYSFSEKSVRISQWSYVRFSIWSFLQSQPQHLQAQTKLLLTQHLMKMKISRSRVWDKSSGKALDQGRTLLMRNRKRWKQPIKMDQRISEEHSHRWVHRMRSLRSWGATTQKGISSGLSSV